MRGLKAMAVALFVAVLWPAAVGASGGVGLVEGGEWEALASLADDPEFLGYVVFLLPQ